MRGFSPTARFVVLLAAALALSVVALLSDGALAILLGFDALLLTALVVDGALTPGAAHFHLTRGVGPHLVHGEASRVDIEVVTEGRGARAEIVDEPPASLLPKNDLAEPIGTLLVAGATRNVGYDVRPRRRGRHVFGRINVIVRGPLGLVARRHRFTPSGSGAVHVYPEIGNIDRGLLDPRLMMAELGIKRQRRREEGTEFESLRDAVLEDELRKMDWRATARRGKLIVRNYEPEKNHEVLICLDTGRLMGAPIDEVQSTDRTKLDEAIRAALRLSALALRNGDKVGVLSFDTRVGVHVGPDKGRRHLGKLMEAVHDLEPVGVETAFSRALLELSHRQRKRALIVVLTDFVDAVSAGPMVEALSVLSRKHAVLFVALRDPHIRDVADLDPEDLQDALRSLAALGLERGRLEVIRELSARGVRALDAPPAQLSASTLQAYLAIRGSVHL